MENGEVTTEELKVRRHLLDRLEKVGSYEKFETTYIGLQVIHGILDYMKDQTRTVSDAEIRTKAVVTSRGSMSRALELLVSAGVLEANGEGYKQNTPDDRRISKREYRMLPKGQEFVSKFRASVRKIPGYRKRFG
jgi:hypothetical protein